MSILALQQVTKSFGRQQILDHVDFTIDTPTIMALVAPNGSGKTTLMDIIANLGRVDSGTVTVLDRPHTDQMLYTDITYMQGDTTLFMNMTGQDHIELIQRSYHLPAERVEQVVGEFGIGQFLQKKVKTYSLGMKQLLLITLALLPAPKLVMLDEPVNGLDPKAVQSLRNALQRLNDQGSTIIFSSHDLSEVDRLTDNVVFLVRGKLVPITTLAPTTTYTVVLPDARFLTTLLDAEQVQLITPTKATVTVPPAEMAALRTKLQGTAHAILDAVATRQGTEALYFKLFSQNEIR